MKTVQVHLIIWTTLGSGEEQLRMMREVSPETSPT